MPPPLLITDLTNLRYLSGIEVTAGVMLLHGKKRLLFVDDRYTEKAREGVKGVNGSKGYRGGIQVLHIDELKNVLKRLKRVRFEADDVTVARLARWKKRFHGTKFIPSENVIEEMRRRKKPEELRAIRKACRITDLVLGKIPSLLSAGAPHVMVSGIEPRGAPTNTHITEKQLAWQIEKLSRDLGADAMAFETIVAFGPNTSRPHHRPTTRKIRKGDLVQIDMGVKVNGYCSDCSRMFFTEKPTQEQRQVFNLLVNIVKETTKMAKTGASNRALDAWARKMMKKNTHVMLGMLPMVSSRVARAPSESRGEVRIEGRSTKPLDAFFLHSLGHGVGLEIHEGLNLTSRKGAKHTKMLPSEVITIEPGIYFEGKWGMRIEDTVLVEGKGGRNLTHMRK